MVRRISLSFVLALLASCVQQSDVAPVPAVPTMVSTELADGATRMATGADGSVYVLGYRNGAEADAPLGYRSEFYVGRFNREGRLAWFTLLPDGGGFEGDNLRGLIADDSAVYALVESEKRHLVHLHKLELDGTLLWSRAILPATAAASAFIAGPDGRLYLSRNTVAGKTFATALDMEGATVWEKEVDEGNTQAVDADGNVYISGFDHVKKRYVLSKYDARGRLLWSRELEPRISKPQGELALGPSISAVVEDDKVYLAMDYLYYPSPSGAVAANVEVRRYSPDGDELWSNLLYPQETGGPADTYTRTLPLGVAPSGALYLLYNSDVRGSDPKQVLRFAPEGLLTQTPLELYGDDINEFSLVQTRVMGDTTENLTMAYAVGVSRNLPCGSGICSYSDASVIQYTVIDTPSPEGAFLYPQWFAR